MINWAIQLVSLVRIDGFSKVLPYQTRVELNEREREVIEAQMTSLKEVTTNINFDDISRLTSLFRSLKWRKKYTSKR